jgi:site-specific DNA recombinase
MELNLKYEREDAPLKRFLKCEKCREFYTAYRKKETIWYYKCNTKGCNCNLNAKRLHEDFKCLLQDLSLNVSPSVSRLIARDMEAVYLESNKESSEQKGIMNRNPTEVNNKLLKLNERFIEGDLDRETYRQMKEKFEGERGQIERQLTKSGNQLSNLEKCIELAIEFSSNLASLWDLSDYGNKQRIQYLVFPQGIFVDKENNDYRTPQVNSVFLYFARLKRVLEQNKTGKTDCNVDFPVPWCGAGSNRRHKDFQSFALPTELPHLLELRISNKDRRIQNWVANIGPFAQKSKIQTPKPKIIPTSRIHLRT